MKTPSFAEDHISQLPALQLLVNMGYEYLSPEEVEHQRGGKASNVLLEGILEQQLRRLNQIEFRGQQYPFSNENIHRAVKALKEFTLTDGLVRTNEQVYDLLNLGKSFEETIQGDRKSYTLRYIDWEHPENNVFHVTEEFSVSRSQSDRTRRPDIVLFVNGIPFVVIECKRPDLELAGGEKPVMQAVSQQIRNQRLNEIPQLFIYSQLLLAISTNDALYATTGSDVNYWFRWREKEFREEEIRRVKNKPLYNKLQYLDPAERFRNMPEYVDQINQNILQVTEQDRLLYALCLPSRLMELVYRFIVFDAGIKKIARYQQYFTVKSILERIKTTENGRRRGGVVWHTQGSGKSLTMVMLAKSIALDIPRARIVLVTDRISLDDQIYKTFKNCQKEVKKATSGKDLIKLIREGRVPVIATIINKFDTALKRGRVQDESPDIFVLVDESHRSQYGIANARMQMVFPNACYIGFTGTPVMKRDKNTVAKFGGLIDPAYTIDQAVEDGAVVPLLYESRHVVQEVNREAIDRYFDMICEPLNEYQKADLKKKFSRSDQLNEADQRVYRTAWDISLHFRNEWQGTGFKGILVAPNKKVALKYQRYMEDIGYVKTEVLISPPDEREGHTEYDESRDKEVQIFWRRMMERFGSDYEYNKQLINAFLQAEEPEIIIVVDKLLTGFDAPRAVVMYICRNLRDHSLLQAIARVNRVYQGKDFGYIIDYYGILGNLDQALTAYTEAGLAEFDEEDLKNTLMSLREEIAKLPQRHSNLWDIFKSITNRRDEEAYERLLADRKLRDDFYEALSKYSRTLKVAMSSMEFLLNTPEEQVKRYTDDLKFFQHLRVSVKARYSDAVDYRQYEPQIQKLIDTHVTSSEVLRLTEQVNIFEEEAFAREVEKVTGKAARADMIATRTARSIQEVMDNDPAFYKKFSQLLEETIEEYRQQRIDDAMYLQRVTEIMETVRRGYEEDIPEAIRENPSAHAFYGIVKETIEKSGRNGSIKELAAEAGTEIDRIIRELVVVDWKVKTDIQNRMRQQIEDYLFDLKDKGLALTYDQMDEIIENAIKIAKNRY